MILTVLSPQARPFLLYVLLKENQWTQSVPVPAIIKGSQHLRLYTAQPHCNARVSPYYNHSMHAYMQFCIILVDIIVLANIS